MLNEISQAQKTNTTWSSLGEELKKVEFIDVESRGKSKGCWSKVQGLVRHEEYDSLHNIVTIINNNILNFLNLLKEWILIFSSQKS